MAHGIVVRQSGHAGYPPSKLTKLQTFTARGDQAMAIGILVLGLFLLAMLMVVVNQFRRLNTQIQTLERTLSSQIYMLQKTIQKEASTRHGRD